MTDPDLSLIPDFDLSQRNTLALRAASRFGVVVSDDGQLPRLFEWAEDMGLPVRILGGGSNVVLARNYDGITAIMATTGRRVVEDRPDHIMVQAAGGEIWHDLVAWTVAQGFCGLENLALIPGTVGAAPVQNIGAYGAELADFFDSLDAYDRTTGTVRHFSKADCAFAYRDSVFKHHPDRFVVLSVRLRLNKDWAPNLNFAGLSDLTGEITPSSVMERVIALRTSKLPDWRVDPNAGSFFQNPIVAPSAVEDIIAEFPTAPRFPQADGRLKLSAGWLIEKVGLKGFRMDRAGISERHALVVINLGDAEQSDIAALAAHVKSEVKTRFGIELHEEPIFT